MNKSLFSKEDSINPAFLMYNAISGSSLGYNDMPQKKEKTMENYKEKPFVVDSYRHFATLAEATAYARKCTMDRKEDTVIQQNIAVVKFPVPDYEVETLSV